MRSKLIFVNALSIKQPWASLIAEGKKTLEIRSWDTAYRGELLICSSLIPAKPATIPLWTPTPRDAPKGVALCVVDLVDVRSYERKDTKGSLTSWMPGAFAWVFQNVRLVEEPFPVKGQLRIFQVSAPELRLR